MSVHSNPNGALQDQQEKAMTERKIVVACPASTADAILGTGVEISERTIRGIRWILICFAICSANMLYGLDRTIVADIQGAVSETFDNVTQLGWLGVGFTPGSTWVFIGCLVNFAAASALCGAAPNMNAMNVGRVWAGVGGAGMYLGTLNLSTILSSPREQPFYVGMTGFVYGSGCILGPIAFYLNLCIFAAPGTCWIDNMKSMDWLGTFVTAGVCGTFTVAFSFGGVLWAYSDGRTITLIVVRVVCTIAFAVTQRFSLLTGPVNWLFPCDFLTEPQLVLLYIIMACGGAALFVSVYYIPLYFQFVYGDTGVEAAVRLLPFICFYVATILFCGAAIARTGYHMVWFVFSGLCLTAGGTCMYTVRQDTPLSNIQGHSVLLGLGMMTLLIQFLNISQGSSQLVRLAIASAVFQTHALDGLKSILGRLGYSGQQIQAAVAGVRSHVLQDVSPEVRTQCLDVIVRTISRCWVLVIAAGALYTLCSLFLTQLGGRADGGLIFTAYWSGIRQRY
ncbi:MFS general substrate transporter [Achaetomium macrosporum]|uniref:MFS general substrate transporter n=1 Tax=Achaetomium macrosporum TaxID=79813 RepID=A0AAN7C2R0_9PEZI|nr:MFS general substrate transporter [Achaetomium macrosporum]